MPNLLRVSVTLTQKSKIYLSEEKKDFFIFVLINTVLGPANLDIYVMVLRNNHDVGVPKRNTLCSAKTFDVLKER